MIQKGGEGSRPETRLNKLLFTFHIPYLKTIYENKIEQVVCSVLFQAPHACILHSLCCVNRKWLHHLRMQYSNQDNKSGHVQDHRYCKWLCVGAWQPNTGCDLSSGYNRWAQPLYVSTTHKWVAIWLLHFLGPHQGSHLPLCCLSSLIVSLGTWLLKVPWFFHNAFT